MAAKLLAALHNKQSSGWGLPGLRTPKERFAMERQIMPDRHVHTHAGPALHALTLLQLLPIITAEVKAPVRASEEP